MSEGTIPVTATVYGCILSQDLGEIPYMLDMNCTSTGMHKEMHFKNTQQMKQ